MSNVIKMTAPCLFGLESVVNFELKQIGATNIFNQNGRVNFEGDHKVLVKANLWLRTAERVLVVLGSFTATTFTQLFDGVAEIAFEDYIGVDDEFPVKGWSLDSKLESVSSCQSIIKKSVVDRLSKKYGIKQFSETGALYQISFYIHNDLVTIMLDTTGVALYKRGYRKDANFAPIRETLAAGIVDFARVRGDSKVYDPMCGSGTLIIEAAQKALNIAPGLNRRFDAEGWNVWDNSDWSTQREQAKSEMIKDADFSGVGTDIDSGAILIAKSNAELAGVDKVVRFEKKDVADFTVESPAIVLCNPPYGERLLEESEAAELYKVMGKVMKKQAGVTYNIIAPPDNFEFNFGQKADKRRKLYNGMIPSQLYMYFR